jgi:hypothetical protein
MTLDLRPEIAQGLETLASAQGLSVEDYLQRLVARELPAPTADAPLSNESGMVWERGLLVYKTGNRLPSHVVDDAIRRLHDERSQHILGNRSLKRFFDSSALVPVFYADHEHHDASTSVYLTATKDDFCARRSLGELYATLTGLPVRPRITGPEAISVVDEIRERLSLVALTDGEYLSTLESASPAIIGSAFYDWLIAKCALKVGATTLITWNVKHFNRFGPDIAQLVRTPFEILER